MNMNDTVICWWSGGITSAVACKLAIDLFGVDRCKIIFIDTKNEDDDTYRFKTDCERLYDCKIETLTAIGNKYDNIQDVWNSFLSLNVATGAICSSELKRQVRIDYQRKNPDYAHQVFGFDIKEGKRAYNIKKNYPATKPIFPLMMYGIDKNQCFKIADDYDLIPPRVYKDGFNNNNCFKTGCVQGGISYWKKIQKMYPEKFDAMALMEHNLTDEKGSPVTVLKDQGRWAKKSKLFQVFLKPHPLYPFHKSIDDMTGREKEELMECNGFCNTENK